MGVYTTPEFLSVVVLHTTDDVDRAVLFNVGDVARALTQVRYRTHFTPTIGGEPVEQDYTVYYWGANTVATVADVVSTDSLDVNEVIPIRALVNPATDLSGMDDFPDSICTPGVRGGGCGWVRSRKDGIGVSGASLIIHVGSDVTPFIAIYKGTKVYFYSTLDIRALSDGMVISNTLSGDGSDFTFPDGSPLGDDVYEDAGHDGSVTLEFCADIDLDCTDGDPGPGEGPPPGTDGALEFLPVRRCSDNSYASYYVAWSGHSDGSVFKSVGDCYYIDFTSHTTATGSPILDTSDPQASCSVCLAGSHGPGEGPPPGTEGALDFLPLRKCSNGAFATVYIEWVGHSDGEVYLHTDGQCYYVDITANTTATNSPLVDETHPKASCTDCNCRRCGTGCCRSRDCKIEFDWYFETDDGTPEDFSSTRLQNLGDWYLDPNDPCIWRGTMRRTTVNGTDPPEVEDIATYIATGDPGTWTIHNPGFADYNFTPTTQDCTGYDEEITNEEAGTYTHIHTAVVNNHCCDSGGDCVQGSPNADGSC